MQYSAAVAWADGRVTREVLSAMTGSRIPDGAAVLRGRLSKAPAVTVASLAVAAGPGAARPLLGRVGLGGVAAAPRAELGLAGGTVRLRLRAYRAGRRAVVEVTTAAGPLVLKVVRPRRWRDGARGTRRSTAGRAGAARTRRDRRRRPPCYPACPAPPARPWSRATGNRCPTPRAGARAGPATRPPRPRSPGRRVTGDV